MHVQNHQPLQVQFEPDGSTAAGRRKVPATHVALQLTTPRNR